MAEAGQQAAEMRAVFRGRASEPKLLRKERGMGGEGRDGEQGGGGEEEFQRVTQTTQLKFSESFREDSVILALISSGGQMLTFETEWSAEK